MKFSVLMSVYIKDDPGFLDVAFKSIIDDQTLKSGQIVLVCDGAISEELDAIIQVWSDRFGKGFDVVRLPENVGLAGALNAGLSKCQFDLIARMDSDDISLPERFEKQVGFMIANPDIAVSSAWIEEVDEHSLSSQGIRYVPEQHVEILKFCKFRNPISHPVCIFRKTAVQKVGGYPMFRTSQDFALWSLMLRRSYRMANLPEVLLKMRTGSGLLKRRSMSYLKQEVKIISYQRKIGFISYAEFLISVLIRSVVRMSPDRIKTTLYRIGRKDNK